VYVTVCKLDLIWSSMETHIHTHTHREIKISDVIQHSQHQQPHHNCHILHSQAGCQNAQDYCPCLGSTGQALVHGFNHIRGFSTF
jgi:hypothetical protein